MQPGLASQWQTITGKFEGAGLNYMYTDGIGCVTTGYGNLIDCAATNSSGKVDCTGCSTPPVSATSLGWLRNSTGVLASPTEVVGEWQTVKNGGAKYASTNAAKVTTLHLSADTIQTLFNSVTASDEAAIRKFIPKYDSLPADAQLALLSMAWAEGTAGLASFKTLVNAVNASPPDFNTAANESHMQGVGIDARNAMDKLAFQNAAVVLQKNLDPSALYWPQSAGSYTPGISDVFGAAQNALTPTNIAVLAGVGLLVYGLHTGKLRRGLRRAGVYLPTSWRRKIPSLPVPS